MDKLLSKFNFYLNIAMPDANEDYLDIKFKETKPLALVISFSAPLIATGLWLWDYIVDPTGSMQTIGLRVLFGFVFLAYTLCVMRGVPRRFLFPIFIICSLTGEVIFIVILSKIHDGFSYGSAAFLYFSLGALIVAMSFDIKSGLLGIFSLALLPNLLPLFGFFEGFKLIIYNVIVLPVCVLAALFLVMFDMVYRRNFFLQRKIEKISTRDSLTGVSNYNYFMKKGRDAIALTQQYKYPISMILIDIDDFKAVNNVHGHVTGDKVIRHIAFLIRKNLRLNDIYGRIGSEEFAVILPKTYVDEAKHIAEKIRFLTEKIPLSINNNRDKKLKVTISAGVVGYTVLPPSINLDGLLKAADDALRKTRHK